jgi:hypothetical protein
MIANKSITKQIYFFLMPDETMSLLDFIINQECIIYADRSSNFQPSEIEYSSFINYSQLFITSRELSDKVEMRKSAGDVYFLDSTTSPVIELFCSILYDNGLSRGRIYFRSGYIGREQWIAFPDILYLIFKNISSFMKKRLFSKERMYGGYISKGSRLYISSGGKLVQF